MTLEPAIPPNRLKRLLQEGRRATGTFVVEFRQPAVMQLLANAGFDFVFIDNEHGAFSMEAVAELSRAAVWLGVTPVVRVPDLTYPYIAQTLDVGAQGLMIPRVTNAQQVREVVRQMRYPPLGARGSALERGFTQFRSRPVLEVIESVHAETILVVQIETTQALDCLDEILAVPGVDAALIGPNDLAIALGVPGQMEHPALVEAIAQTIEACQRNNVCPAIHLGDPKLAAAWAGRGMRMISTGSEVSFIQRAGREALAAIRGEFLSEK
jgi:2-dehydro-3-deoxyglucarate aldolase/4-hydroxy-2-oxoheptanedioate aldolase